MTNQEGTSQTVTRREHDLTLKAKRVIPVDPFGGLVTNGNYTMKVETSGADTYIGIAQIGTATSESLWQIKKVNVTGSVTTITWAESTDAFTNKWDDKATYTYA